MGFGDWARSVVSGGGESSDDISDSFEDEFAEDSLEDGFDDEEDDISLEWETGYQAAEELLMEEGFGSMKEFIDHAMMLRIKQSPMYRNRIESGAQTMSMITESFRGVSELQSQFSSDRAYQDFAEDIKAANDIISELDKMEGQDERMANEIIGTAQMLAKGLIDNRSRRRGIESSVELTDEEL